MSLRITFFLLLLPAFFFNHCLLAQTNYLPLENSYLAPFSKSLNKPNKGFHASIRPYLQSEVDSIINVDSLDRNRNLFFLLTEKANTSLFSSSKFSISANALISLMPGYEFADTITRSRLESFAGASINSKLGKKLFFNANYITARSSFPSYVQNKIDSSLVVPGSGYAYGSQSENLYSNWSGYLSYSPSDIFNFTLGHGKNFWGNGYRSLLLSDVSNNYSFLKITTTVGKFKYVNLFANFKDISTTQGLPNYWNSPNKFGSFHYLSWNMAKWLNISFFETVIWPEQDNEYHRGFDINYLNPVAFFRPVEYSLGSSDNSLMGLNVDFRPFKKHQFYGQLMIDEFLLEHVKANFKHYILNDATETEWGWWANKQAIQLGYKWFDAFFLKNLVLQMEYNFIPPYTYAHTGGLLNYGNFNEQLAHNSGANLHELIAITRYIHKSWYIELKNMYLITGKDTGNINYGGNIYNDYGILYDEFQNYTGQGLTSKIIFNQFKMGYCILPKSNLVIEWGITNRLENNINNSYSTNYIFGGIKTSLSNIYHDF